MLVLAVSQQSALPEAKGCFPGRGHCSTVPDNVGSAGLLHVVETVAPRLGVQLLIAPIRNAADIEDAFNRIRGDANTGVLVLPGAPAADNQGFFIISLAKRHHVPVIYPIRSFVTLGGLIFYGYASLMPSSRLFAM